MYLRNCAGHAHAEADLQDPHGDPALRHPGHRQEGAGGEEAVF